MTTPGIQPLTGYRLRDQDWPTTGRPTDPDAARRVLADFDRHYPAAVRSLAETTVPRDADDTAREDA